MGAGQEALIPFKVIQPLRPTKRLSRCYPRQSCRTLEVIGIAVYVVPAQGNYPDRARVGVFHRLRD